MENRYPVIGITTWDPHGIPGISHRTVGRENERVEFIWIRMDSRASSRPLDENATTSAHTNMVGGEGMGNAQRHEGPLEGPLRSGNAFSFALPREN